MQQGGTSTGEEGGESGSSGTGDKGDGRGPVQVTALHCPGWQKPS